MIVTAVSDVAEVDEAVWGFHKGAAAAVLPVYLCAA